MAATYTVKYSANTTDSVFDVPSQQIKTEGIALALSALVPTREGYVFEGWAISADGAVVYTPGSVYAEEADATLYAVWRYPEVHLFYGVNGEWKPVEMFYGDAGAWRATALGFGLNGAWKTTE